MVGTYEKYGQAIAADHANTDPNSNSKGMLNAKESFVEEQY
jgi:hypothetical protein